MTEMANMTIQNQKTDENKQYEGPEPCVYTWNDPVAKVDRLTVVCFCQ